MSDTTTESADTTVLGGPDASAGGAADAKPETDAGGKAPAAESKPAAEGKPADKAAAPAPVEWDKWAPKPVEGLARDEKQLGQFRELAKKHGLTGEAAQAIVEMNDAMARAQAEADLAHLDTTQKTWREELRGDAEYGGAKLKETLSDVERAMKKYGTPELAKVLNETRFGDNPELVKFVARMGRAMREDKATNGARQPPSAKQTLLDQLYGTTSSKS